MLVELNFKDTKQYFFHFNTRQLVFLWDQTCFLLINDINNRFSDAASLLQCYSCQIRLKQFETNTVPHSIQCRMLTKCWVFLFLNVFFLMCLYLVNSLYLSCHVRSARLSLQLFTSCVSVLHDTGSITEWQFTQYLYFWLDKTWQLANRSLASGKLQQTLLTRYELID